MGENVMQNANRCKDKAFLQLSHGLGIFFLYTKKEAEASFVFKDGNEHYSSFIGISQHARLSL